MRGSPPELFPGVPSMTRPMPSRKPDNEERPSHRATIWSVPSMIVASTDPPVSVGSIRMFWTTPATLHRSRAVTDEIGRTPSIVDDQRRRLSARLSSGGIEALRKRSDNHDTVQKYGSIPAR